MRAIVSKEYGLLVTSRVCDESRRPRNEGQED